MERLFSPCTRLRNMLQSQGSLERFGGYSELSQELNLDVSTEELLSVESAFTYADVCAMLGNGNTFLWLTPHAAVVRADGIAERFCDNTRWDSGMRGKFSFYVDGQKISTVARSYQHLLEICSAVLRLLAASVVHSVHLSNLSSGVYVSVSINSLTFADLMQQCQSLKALTLD
jgi:hypothetical protein